jgi:hypothetical protein
MSMIANCRLQIANCKLKTDERAAQWGLVRFAICNLQFAIYSSFLLGSVTSLAQAADAPKKVVIPFDFVSKFDDGRYGQMLGDMIWKKLSREGRFTIPESMLEVRDYCESHKLAPLPEMDLDKMKKIVRDDFDAQIGIWGSVERVPGTEGERYDLVIKCVDFSAQPRPKVIFETSARTKSVSEIPHVYVKQMLDALYGRKPGSPPAPDLAAEENWKKNPNLVIGDFEQGADGVPKGWDRRCGQQREPLGTLVRWLTDPDRSDNKIVRFTLDKNVAENEGVMYYSDYFPVEEGAKYRFQCRWRTDGPDVKVFVKCYDEIGSPYRGSGEGPAAASGGGRPKKGDYISDTGQRREVYRSQQNLKGPQNVWNTHTEDFTPRHTKYTPRWGRVMLYAYLRPGTVDFDDVVVKQIVAPSAGDRTKVRRPSSESKVTDRDIEANERRSRQSPPGK